MARPASQTDAHRGTSTGCGRTRKKLKRKHTGQTDGDMGSQALGGARMGAISSTRSAVAGRRAARWPQRSKGTPGRVIQPGGSWLCSGEGGVATCAIAHTQGWARPLGQLLSGAGASSSTTHCMPVGVQISATGPLATAGTTHAPSRPCSAENTVHTHSRCSQRRPPPAHPLTLSRNGQAAAGRFGRAM